MKNVLIIGCGEKIEPKHVIINRTLKVQSSQNWDTAEELRFMWTPPQGPKGNDAKWIVNDDIMLFTPDVSGEYTISLMVEDLSGEVLGEEIFYNKVKIGKILINQPYPFGLLKVIDNFIIALALNVPNSCLGRSGTKQKI